MRTYPMDDYQISQSGQCNCVPKISTSNLTVINLSVMTTLIIGWVTKANVSFMGKVDEYRDVRKD